MAGVERPVAEFMVGGMVMCAPVGLAVAVFEPLIAVVSGGGEVFVEPAGRNVWWRRRWSCSDRPSGRGGAQAEHGEARQVGGSGEEVEVGVDFGSAADSGAASAVSSTHQVTELAFDFGTGCSVVGLPGGVGLTGAGSGQGSFVAADGDGATGGGGRALRAQRTAAAVLSERGGPRAVSAAEIGRASCRERVSECV